MSAQPESFEAVRDRLEQIVDEVNAEGITLDEALCLYEEAVKLGLAACDLSEQDALEAAAQLDVQPDGSPAPGGEEAAAAPEGSSEDASAEACGPGADAGMR